MFHSMEAFEQLRRQMIQEQMIARGINDARVLQAIEQVPREKFVDPKSVALAYEDSPLPIGGGQTISQPFIVALMLQLAQLHSDDKVLEVGTGSGYSAAVLSLLCSQVYSIDRDPELARLARLRLEQLGYANVTIGVGDGTLGWLDHAPYQAIIVTAAGPQIPPSLLNQLAIGGRLVIPVGLLSGFQQLMRVVREGEDHFRSEAICGVQFVPLVGKEGWQNKGESYE